MEEYKLSHLKELEAESIHIIRAWLKKRFIRVKYHSR